MSIKKSLLLAFIFFQFSASSALAETFLIIEHGECAKATTEGGWGGSCEALFLDGDVTSISEFFGGSNGCDNDAEKPVGLCGSTGSVDGGLREACCVPKTSSTRGKVVGQFMEEESTCTASPIGGTCQSSSCDSSTQDYIGICEDTVSDDYCCAPKGQVVPPSVSGAVVGAADGVGNHGGDRADIGNVGNINVNTVYTPLENVPFIKDASSFQSYLEGIYILGMVLVVIGAVFMLVIGGFQYLTSAGNTSALSAAKHTIEGALFGLALALIAYLILYVINPDLVKLNITRFQPLPQQAPPTSSGGGAGGGGAGGGGGTGYFAAKQSSDVYTDAEARRVLSAAGISVNKANCSSPSQTSCTSLDQIPKSAINFAVALKRDCNCRLIVTGGTEAGHSTHGKNRAALDISRDVSATIKSTPAISTSGGRPVYSYNGFRVWDEDSAHFHAWEPANP
jgi:hypothetical protein